MYYAEFETTLCPMVIVGDETGIRHLHLYIEDDSKHKFTIPSEWIESYEFFLDVIRQIEEYLKGERKVFEVALSPEGTLFQKRVWKELCNIPYGETFSYKELAKCTGNLKAYRAVGTANAKNPLPIIIPCHRVVKSNKEIGDYAFGSEVKRMLIELEANSDKS